MKTIGDAVMATFPTPDRALAAALRMRDAMRTLNGERGKRDLLLKIGIHEGPCLAVTLNNRQDYFGQTVNIASRVQNLAVSHAIFATGSVVEDAAGAGSLPEAVLLLSPDERRCAVSSRRSRSTSYPDAAFTVHTASRIMNLAEPGHVLFVTWCWVQSSLPLPKNVRLAFSSAERVAGLEFVSRHV